VGIYPFERFTESAKRALTMAQEEAQRLHHPYIGSEHLLLGLLREGPGLAAKILNNLGAEITTVRATIESVFGRNEPVIQQIVPTSRVKKVIEISFEEARQLGNSYVGTEHLLLGLLIEGEGVAAQVLADLGANLDTVREELARMAANGETEATDQEGDQGRPAYQPRYPGVRRAPGDDAGAHVILGVVGRAVGLAGERGERLGAEHFLLALAEQDSTKAREILEGHGLTRPTIENILDGPGSGNPS
jgi:Clp amino terminal domain, pathogenicity island component